AIDTPQTPRVHRALADNRRRQHATKETRGMNETTLDWCDAIASVMVNGWNDRQLEEADLEGTGLKGTIDELTPELVQELFVEAQTSFLETYADDETRQREILEAPERECVRLFVHRVLAGGGTVEEEQARKLDVARRRDELAAYIARGRTPAAN